MEKKKVIMNLAANAVYIQSTLNSILKRSRILLELEMESNNATDSTFCKISKPKE